MSRRLAGLCLGLISLVVLGTIAVLGTAKYYFDIDARDLITLEETQEWLQRQPVPYHPLKNGSSETSRPVEKIPRILHQTWKSDTLPERWAGVIDKCREMHPDYEYMLWTDVRSREFISQHYPWFLDTWDGYTYPIQRADAIRYFVLHHYGGIYLDLDIGCKRPLDPLLNFDVVLPHTIPIGISNDLIFSSPRHPFMELTIHNLITFDHTYGTNYPTVMFSTGPMFLSAQYNLWPSNDGDHGGVRVLPKSLYGKNAPPEETEAAFFWHYYGSSWHANDAGFIRLVGNFGMFLLYLASALVCLGFLRMLWQKRKMVYGKSAGPISLPFTPSSSEFLNGYFTPAPSRPTSPLPYHANHHRDRRGSSLPGTSSSNAAGGKLYWVPMFLSASNDSNADKASGDSLTFDASANRWTPASQATHLDSDAASLHSMHTIKASAAATPRARSNHARHSSAGSLPGISVSDSSCSEDDGAENQQLLSGGRRRRYRGSSGSGGLPPSYSNVFANWATSLFRPGSTPPRDGADGTPKPLLGSSTSSSTVGPENPTPRGGDALLNLGSPSRPLSRQSSFSSPPAYPDEAPGAMDVSAVDQLLSEMDPQKHRQR